MPFGGTKASGYGRFGRKAAIDEFTELRWITGANRAAALSFLDDQQSVARGLLCSAACSNIT